MWKTISPRTRADALDVLFGRPSWTTQYLEYALEHPIAAAQVAHIDRQRLLQHKSREIRRQANTTFRSVINAERQTVVDQYHQAPSLPGCRERGRKLYVKHCSACHEMEGTGRAVGPSLSSLSTRPDTAWIEAIFAPPNRSVEPRYVGYTVVDRNENMFTGLIVRETGRTLTLLAGDGKQQTVLRCEVMQLSGTGMSLMPDGFEKELDRQQTSDLLRYLAKQ